MENSPYFFEFKVDLEKLDQIISETFSFQNMLREMKTYDELDEFFEEHPEYVSSGDYMLVGQNLLSNALSTIAETSEISDEDPFEKAMQMAHSRMQENILKYPMISEFMAEKGLKK